MQITLDLPYDSTTLTPGEVAGQYLACRGTYAPKDGEEVCAYLTCEGLNIEVIGANGETVHAEIIYLDDIRETFTHADYYVWGQDEDENDILVCFGGR